MDSTNHIDHKILNINGIKMHVAEIGQGPVVLFLHGFPELWYTWRHQLPFMAAHGYRAVAPDLRGYGDTLLAENQDSTKFTTSNVVGENQDSRKFTASNVVGGSDEGSRKFTSVDVVGDIVGLIDVIVKDGEKVFVVGHDWGAVIAWALCLYRPDKVKGLINMSVVFSPRNPKSKPIETLRAVYVDDYYISRFQKPGEIEAVFAEAGTRVVLEKFFTYRNPGPLYLPKGKEFEGLNPSGKLPFWLSEKDMDYYVSKYEKTGFTGGLNYYRALDLNWELTAPWTGAQIKVPTKFIVGDLDLTYNAPGTKDYIHKGGFKKYVPLLEDVVVMEGVAHFLHEEKPDEVNKHILDFITKCH